MKARALGRVFELPQRDAQSEGPPQLVDAVNALLFGVSLIAPPQRIPTPTPIELACRAAAESQSTGGAASDAAHHAAYNAALDLAPHISFAARALDASPANDASARPTQRKARTADGPSAGDVEAMVRLAAAHAASTAAPHPQNAATPVAGPTLSEPAPSAAPRTLVPTLLAAHTADVEFAAGGADASIDISHPELGPIRLELSFSAGGVSLRALTPSTTTALALRALEPAVARALAARGLAFRSLRVDVASDSRATVSRTQRRRRDLEEEG